MDTKQQNENNQNKGLQSLRHGLTKEVFFNLLLSSTDRYCINTRKPYDARYFLVNSFMLAGFADKTHSFRCTIQFL